MEHSHDIGDATREDEWLWGWDPTPGIVSVWAERDGRAWVWRRLSREGAPAREAERFRPWLLLDSLDYVAHLGARLGPESEPAAFTYRELAGHGELRYVVSAEDGRALEAAVLAGANARREQPARSFAELGECVLALPPEEQYLVATGRTYFRGLAFDDPHRLQFDLETTGLDASHDAIFLIAARSNRGLARVLDVGERDLAGAAAEADLLRRFVALMREADPDVIENHNLHGFDLPFLAQRARRHGVRLDLGRIGAGLRERATGRGYGTARAMPGEAAPDESSGRVRYVIPGRETIDTLDAVRRYDFVARDLPGHGLKAVARHFGLAAPDRAYIAGAEVFATWRHDPDRVRHYALDDVTEAGELARLLGGAAFALARMAPRRYERVADAGPATGILDPLLARAYLRAGEALPAYVASDGTQHSGAALYLFAAGLARRVVKADVSSLYPSLMRQYRIGPRSDHLGALLALVDRLVEQRLAAKTRAKTLPPGSPERHNDEAISAAMKILVNSAYGYMGAVGLTRFADVHAANEVTRRGREVLALLCRELAARGVTLLEADTDGVYFAVPDDWSEEDERHAVAEVGAILPPLVRLEFEGRYQAMLSHETKNYALLTYEGEVLLRGVAFRSIKFEPFGAEFLRVAIGALLRGDVAGIRAAYCDTVRDIQRRELATESMASPARLTKTPAHYHATRPTRREAMYEAMLASGRTDWRVGEKVLVYRATSGYRVLAEGSDPRDYDVAHGLRLLRENYAARLARAFTPDDFAALVADPDRPALFASPLATIQPVLTTMMDVAELAKSEK